MSRGWPDFWITGKINQIRDVFVPEGKRTDAIANAYFEQELTGWRAENVNIEPTQDPTFLYGNDAVLTSINSVLAQFLDPPIRTDELHEFRIRCKGAASGDIYVIFVAPSGLGTSQTVTISDSWDTYTVSVPYDEVNEIRITPVDPEVVPVRIKFVSAPLKTLVYQASTERTIANFPSEYPLPSSQVSDLKDVTVGNFPSEYPLPSSQISDLKDVTVGNFPSEYPLPSSQISDLKNVAVTDVSKTCSPVSFDVSASSSGNNAIWTPASGKAIRLKLIQYESDADVEVGLRFGDSGSLFARRVTAGVMALNLIGCNIQGGTDEVLNLYTGGAVNVKGFVLGEEI